MVEGVYERGGCMKKIFAFLLMGKHYDCEKHQAMFETEGGITYIFTVNSFEMAYKKLLDLKEEGVGVVEVCGAFGEERAREMMALTDNQVGIGFVVHVKEQDELFEQFFLGE